MLIKPTCKMCNNRVKRDYVNKRWRTYCSPKCRANDPDFHTKIVEKYGGHPGHTRAAIEKRKRTCLEKYGVEFPLQHKNIHNQTVSTSTVRHGGLLRSSKTINEKIRTKMIERHGVEYSGQSSKLLQIKIKIY